MKHPRQLFAARSFLASSMRCPAWAASARPTSTTDWIGGTGCFAGVAQFTLEAARYMSVDGRVIRDRVVVAHLRMPLPAMATLKKCIEDVELMVKSPASEERN